MDNHSNTMYIMQVHILKTVIQENRASSYQMIIS